MILLSPDQQRRISSWDLNILTPQAENYGAKISHHFVGNKAKG